MTKLWDKGYALDERIEKFTVGDDPVLDKALIYYDCVGSIAHAQMLQKIGVLTESEYGALKKALKQVIALAQEGTFTIEREDEDVHTALENKLVTELGDVGKKIHTARSRNDQVLLDLRLYMRSEILENAECVLELCHMLLARADEHRATPMAGRTHFQRAMPSSVGLLFGAYAESLLDTMVLIKSTYAIINQCPLGSAASYGVNLPIDRQLVSDLLGFDHVQNNVLYANNSRGKFESIVLSTLNQIMSDLSKIATDLIIFSSPEFGYFSLPEELCSGSSLMPQKRNPCGLELVRAKSATVLGHLVQTLTLIRALPSGYNRDFQETKKPLMESVEITKNSLAVCTLTIKKLRVHSDACIASLTPELFATDQALALIAQQIPFRDAYKMVATHLDSVLPQDPVANITAKTHHGAPGNLNITVNQERRADFSRWVTTMKSTYDEALQMLLEDAHDQL